MRFCSILLITFFWFIPQCIHSQEEPNPLEKYYDATEWRHIGPFRGGRSCAVTGVSNHPLLYYFGSTGGGVWKTQDGGQSWSNISDGFFGGSIGSIEVSKSDPNVIYVGGGEKTVRGNVSYGYGMWKTEDGGENWAQMGLKKSKHITRVRIDPNDHNIAYASVLGDLYKSSKERGVFKTVDGGKSWKKVLYANENAGAVDLIIDPNNPRILYATTWNVRRTPYSLSSGGEGSSLWKSMDQGETWTDIKENEGLPEGIWGISGITVSPINSNRLWSIIENEKGGVYRSDDGGETWKKMNDERKLRQRAWYYTRIYADSQDPEIVYVLNVRYHRSKDGGKTFDTYNAPHGDHHDLWIDPNNNQRMIIGDDGGAQVSFDGGGNWSTYHNQPTAQFYRVTTDNHFPFRIYAAQQDNSTIRISHRAEGRSIGERDWESTAGGESAHIAIDPDNNEIVYGGSYGGYLTRLDHTTKKERAINIYPDNPMGHGAEGMKYRFQWNFPIQYSRHNPDRLYALSNHVHVTENEGQTWKVISPDLTRNDSLKLVTSGGPITKDNTGVEYYCTLFAITESVLKEGIIWVGSDDGLIHVTKNNGDDWQNVTPPTLPEWTMINCLEADPHMEGGVYLAATSYKLGDYKPYLFKTSDYGASWIQINRGIDSEHFTRAIRVDPNQQGMLYAGTESGMYLSWNDGKEWFPFQMNLPIVPITDLTIKEDKLIAATQGRSIWMIDDLSVVRNAEKIKNQDKLYLSKPNPAYRIKGRQDKEVKGAGINHPGGVSTHFYLPIYDEEKDTITLNYLTTEGDTIASFSNHNEDEDYTIDVKEGSNIFNWNMRYKKATSFKGMILWWGSMNGPKALPGEYEVRLNHTGINQEVLTQKETNLSQSFTILPDPRSPSNTKQLKEHFDFIKEVNGLVSKSHESILEMRKLKEQLSSFSESQKDSVINKEIKITNTKLDSLEKLLYQTNNQSRQDPLNYPIRLTNKLAHLNSLIQIGDDPPTDSMIEVKEVLSKEIKGILKTFTVIKKEDIPKINSLIKERITDFIKLD